jgi:hypothetical protein
MTSSTILIAAWSFGVTNHIYKRYAYISHRRHFNIKILRDKYDG